MIKTQKSLRYLKKEGLLETAAWELVEGTAIGPCSIGKHFLLVQHEGVAIPLENTQSCTVYPNCVRLKTDLFGEVVISGLDSASAQQIYDALPLEGKTLEVVKTKSR